MLDRRWLAVVTAGWLLINFVRAGTAAASGEDLLPWMLIQQLWLIIGSWLTVRQARILRWEARGAARGVLAGIALFCGTAVLNMVIVGGLSWIFPKAQVERWLMQEQMGINMLLSIKNAAKFWLAAAAITIGAPVSEELFFRGVILTALREAVSARWAVILGALVFACVHFYLIQFVPVLVSGIVLGWLYLNSGNLCSAVTAHLVVNTLALAAHIL